MDRSGKSGGETDPIASLPVGHLQHRVIDERSEHHHGGRRQIDATHRPIDQVVYDLYGLTDDEIHIVEETSGAV